MTSFPTWPHYDEDEIAAAAAVLRSGKVNYWTGDEARRFEREYAAYTGTRHAIALANGTVALELALYAFGIGQGDEVITSSRTFIASASAARRHPRYRRRRSGQPEHHAGVYPARCDAAHQGHHPGTPGGLAV